MEQPKAKRVMSEKQREAFQRAVAQRQKNIEARKQAKLEQKEERKIKRKEIYQKAKELVEEEPEPEEAEETQPEEETEPEPKKVSFEEDEFDKYLDLHESMADYIIESVTSRLQQQQAPKKTVRREPTREQQPVQLNFV